MAVVPLTRTKHLISVASYLTQFGTPIQPLLEKAKLPADALARPEMLVPSSAVWQFRELAAQVSGLSNIVINATEKKSIADLGDFGRSLMQAPTLYRLLTKFCTLSLSESSVTPIKMLERKNGDVFFHFCFLFSQKPGEWQSTLYVLIWMLKMVRLVNPDWSPLTTHVSCSCPPNVNVVKEKLGLGKMSFSYPFTGFLIPRSMLALPLPIFLTAPVMVKEDNDSSVWLGAPGQSYSSTLQQTLTAYENDKWLTIDELAEVIGSSSRTIQRRLRTEGSSYTGLIKNTRSERAAHLLKNTDASIIDVTEQLGYSAESNFCRAFKAWSGVSPLQYRISNQSHL